MNDLATVPRAVPVRPRDAASLIVLRGEGADLELLAGRRPLSARFMPGVWVFPGGAIDPGDRAPWRGEVGAETLVPRLARCARAALRETWEEAGVLIGRRGAVASDPAGTATPIEAAYAAAGAVPAFDILTYVGRAITPSHVFRRFNTRFFLCDDRYVVGEPVISDELEEVGWHPIGRRPLEPFRDVTVFMLAQAKALRAGTAAAEPPLFCWAKNARRIRVCRESMSAAGGMVSAD